GVDRRRALTGVTPPTSTVAAAASRTRQEPPVPAGAIEGCRMVDVTVPGTGQTVPDDEQVDTLFAGRSSGLVWHSRTQRAAPPGTIFFAGGVPDPTEYPLGTLTEIIGGVLREDDAEGMTYVPEPGYLGLREAIAGRHAGRDGLAVDPGQVTITNGTAGALVLA